MIVIMNFINYNYSILTYYESLNGQKCHIDSKITRISMFCFNVGWGVYQLFGSISWLVCTMQTEFAVNVITHVYGHRKIRYWSGRMNQ